jgi:hypothetical protein
VRTGLWIALALAALVLLDRGALALERRGWIYWRKRKAKGSAVGAVVLDLQKIFESGKSAHVIQAQRDRREKRPDAGDGKD